MELRDLVGAFELDELFGELGEGQEVEVEAVGLEEVEDWGGFCARLADFQGGLVFGGWGGLWGEDWHGFYVGLWAEGTGEYPS